MLRLSPVLLMGNSDDGVGQQLFTSSGTWVCPGNVTRISVLCVGKGGNGGGAGLSGGGGGALGYK
ncbi:MAG: hypothetical protein MUC86_13435, partial [Burkholderiaceae bacterium]|nr:hypothetical protein [Burkholderiaceae bacterium]